MFRMVKDTGVVVYVLHTHVGSNNRESPLK